MALVSDITDSKAMTILEDTLAGIWDRDLLACNTPVASLQYNDKSAAAIQCCATILMKRPRRWPGCLITCRVARRTLQSFISCGWPCCRHAADTQLGGPPRLCLNGWRLWCCVRCSTRHRRVGDRGPGHAGLDQKRRDIPCLHISIPCGQPSSSSLPAVGKVGQE